MSEYKPDNRPVKIIACEVMKSELCAIECQHEVEFEFVPMGLHLHPHKLRLELQEMITRADRFSRIILGFGLCGGAASGIRAINVPLTIPRVHDCIPLLVGSPSVYREIAGTAGTFYLSGGWIKGKNSIRAEYDRILSLYGRQKTDRVIKTMFAQYRRFLYIKTGHRDEQALIAEAADLSAILGLSFDTLEGKTEYLHSLVNGPWNDEMFITVPPGEEVRESMFMKRNISRFDSQTNIANLHESTSSEVNLL